MIESFAIHTAVLVGLVVTWLWTERLGGVFAGFAVPGYVGAIALVAPASAATLVLEAILTWAVVWVLGEGLPRLGVWARVFGRERFLLFVLVSVPVRLVVEGLAAGGLQAILGPWFPDGAGDGFFSVGLVLVPLLANTFWKPGLIRGLLQVSLTTGLTMVVLIGLVMPVLGLSFSSFFLSFEDIALAFVAVPKVYVILICTAVVATWTAERFGFNAGGLLVPALLGLLILEPTKLLTTGIEIVLLTVTYRVVTSLPGLRSLELAGARRLVAMYVMAWGLKLTFAWVGQQLEIPVATWNLYGFGYLLSSLVAVRCLDLRPMGRVLLPMGLNIGAGAGVGLAASFVLSTALPEQAAEAERGQRLAPRPLVTTILHLAGEVREDPGMPGSFAAVLRGLPWQVEAPDGLTPLGVLPEPALRRDGTPCVVMRSDASGAPGPMATWCGGEGPIGVVLAPRTDPDSVWLGAWLLDEGVLPGLVMLDVDGAIDPRRAERLVRGVRTRVPDRELVVLQTGPTTRLLPAGSPTARRALQLPGAQQPVPVALGAPPPQDASWFEGLGARDAVLEIAVADAERALPDEPDPLDPVGTSSARDADDLDPRSSFVSHLALSRSAQHEPGDPVPPGLLWAADAVDLRMGSDDSAWVLEEDEDRRRFGRLLVRLGPVTDHVVVASRAPDEQGTAGVALALGEALKARAVWIARRRHRGLEARLDHRLDGEDAATASLREALRRQPGAIGRVVSVRRATIAVPDPPIAVLAEAREGLSELPDAFLPLAVALDRLYPGWQRATGRELDPASVSSLQPLRYAESLTRGRVATVWVREDALAEVSGTRDRDALIRWYGLQGVAIGTSQADLRRPLQTEDGLLRAMLAHLETPTLASTAALQRRGTLSLLPSELRIDLALRTADQECIGRTGAPVESPSVGCWALQLEASP